MRGIEISASDARDLTDRIKTGVEAIWELIKQAYQSRAWAALGYDSWDDYCTREFGTSRIRLPREERQEVVASMREIGMSTRAIASATGNNRKTIMSDLRGGESQVVQNGPPAPVAGTDGKTYTPRPSPRPEPEPEPESGGEEDTPAPSWEPAGHIHPADLAALNRPEPTPNPAPAPRPAAEKRPHTSEHAEYRNPAEHVTKLMQHMRTATKALKEAIFTAQHIDNWSGGDITSDLRTQLDELDNTLDSGGFDMELARLLKEQDDE